MQKKRILNKLIYYNSDIMLYNTINEYYHKIRIIKFV